MNTRRIATAVGVVLLLALTCATAEAQSWRDRLRRAAEGVGAVARTMLPISTEKEIEIGRGIAATVAGRYPVSTDSELTTYLSLVGLVVAGEAPRPDIVYRFAVLETEDVNAFAAPGGYIFVTRGALALIETEAELAGVLAHEVGHVNRRHVIEQIRKADFMREVRDQSGIAGDALDRVVGHGANVLFTGLSREDEAEADSIGIELAAAAGYDARGLEAFVTRLGERGSEGRLAELMSTHPRPAERVERLRGLAAGAGYAGGAVLAERYVENVRRTPPRGLPREP